MDIKIEDLPEQPVIGIRYRTSMEKIQEDIGQSYAALFEFLGRKQVAPAGPPGALYYDMEMDESDFEMEAFVPVVGEVEGEGEVPATSFPRQGTSRPFTWAHTTRCTSSTRSC